MRSLPQYKQGVDSGRVRSRGENRRPRGGLQLQPGGAGRLRGVAGGPRQGPAAVAGGRRRQAREERRE